MAKYLAQALLVTLTILLILNPIQAQAGRPMNCDKMLRELKSAEKSCVNTLSLPERKYWLEKELLLMQQMDAFGCEETPLLDCLCAGTMDLQRTAVSIFPQSSTLKPNQTLQLSSTINTLSCVSKKMQRLGCFDKCSAYLEENLQGEITWGSADINIADIDINGLVTAKSLGIATIVARSIDISEIVGTTTVAVADFVDRVVLSPSEVSVWPETTYVLHAILLNADGQRLPLESRTITWSSSDQSVLAISNSGLEATLTGIRSGTAIVTATVESKQGSANITVFPKCPDLPEYPNCSVRIHNETKSANTDFAGSVYGYVNSPVIFAGSAINLNPDEEAIINLGITLGCCGACINLLFPSPGCTCVPPDSPTCPLMSDSCSRESAGMIAKIYDQNRALLGSYQSAGIGSDSHQMIARGQSGTCGNPTTLEIESIGKAVCVSGNIQYYNRPGWNMAGMSLATASDVGESSSWCGNRNETPCGDFWTNCSNSDSSCTENPIWKVYLDTGDRVNIAAYLQTEAYGGTYVELELRDENYNLVKTLWSTTVPAAGYQKQLSFTNTNPLSLYYIVLNVRNPVSNGESLPCHDLWEYGLSFNRVAGGCVDSLPPPKCPVEEPVCAEP